MRPATIHRIIPMSTAWEWLQPLLEGERSPLSPSEWGLMAVLRPFGTMYAAVQGMRRWGYRQGWLRSFQVSGCQVISIGNLTAGGTGKTPMVHALARHLQRQGRRVAILSRGYRQQSRAPVTVVSDAHGIRIGPPQAADEAYLLARRLPGVAVLTGARRSDCLRHATHELGIDTAILDDGFQHLAVHRDHNWVLLDARHPLANGRVLPAGLLREGPGALQDADLLIVTRATTDEALTSVRDALPVALRDKPLVVAHHRPVAWWHMKADGTEANRPLSDGPVRSVAFCGIARPEPFFTMLGTLGCHMVDRRTFPDHHAFSPADLALLCDQARTMRATLVCTEKDAVKIHPHWLSAGISLHALCIEMDAPWLRSVQPFTGGAAP